jgi:GT2 family glycosyltransferase/glycosyltransferase involved in cell wall biosynthesis
MIALKPSLGCRALARLSRVAAYHPCLAFIVEKSLKAVYLTREGQLFEHTKAYLAYCRRRWRLKSDARAFKRKMLARVAPLDVFRSLLQPFSFSADSIVFPTVDAPLVSVVIPGYGQRNVTGRCLDSLAKHKADVPFEVIVAEDASGDPAIKELAKVKGLIFIDRAHNMGFLRSCNEAVRHARGTYVFILNNDTYVMPGAIDALVRLLEKRPDAGMVGARLVYPDGLQQEGGGLIWDDGSAWNYGRRDSPFKPEYNYVREAGYISGAAIMLRKSLWDELGGFDEHYLPAYCEDSDLAFRVREKELKVLYQPAAWVIHYEGLSHGTDTATGVKAYQVANNRKLKERWGAIMARDFFPSGTHLLRARDMAKGRKITLVIDHYVPEPDRDAGSRTMVAFMESLQATGRVIKFWPDNGVASTPYTDALQQRGIEVLYGPLTRGFAAWIRENGADIDEILLSRPTVAPAYIPLLRLHAPQAPIVFYGHDLHHARMALEAEIAGDPAKKLAAEAMKRKEIEVWRAVDMTLYPSADEITALHALAPDVPAAPVSPYAFPEASPRRDRPPAANGIIFVAGFAHTPNEDAALWFADAILPLIRRERPDVPVALVGSNPTAKVKALAAPNLDVTGFVSDDELERRYAQARVAVAPLRFGAGVKLKVVEAMQHGVPLVTTPVGVQGLQTCAPALDVTDDPSTFANAVLRLLADDAVWDARATAEIEAVNRAFSAATQREDLDRAFAAAGEKRNATRNAA